MRAVGITFLSLSLTTIVIGNAYYQKKQFYPSVVYITKSNPSMAVIYVQAFIIVMLTGKLMRKIFFGQLRAAEFEHLMERSWYAITETCLAFTVFRDDFSPKFVALFTVLLFLKSFHWLAEDRVDFMERSPVISWLFHIRVLSLLVMLGSLDMFFVSHAYQSTIAKGASVQLVFGFEYAILLTIVINISIKYALHAVDLNSENPWENKAVFLLYTELIMGFFKVILYIAFVGIMVKIYTLPLFAFRPMYYTLRAFKKAFNDVILSRRAIRNMNTLYPDATPEELAAADNVCIICREEMVTASKKLPCNHIFHTSCLRSWFQRQQTCPTCRLNILRTPTGVNHNQGAHVLAQPPPPPPPPPAAPPQPAGAPQLPAGANPFQPLLGVAPFMGPFPFWQQFGQAPAHAAAEQRPAENRPQAPQFPSTAATSTTTSTSTTATSSTTQSTTTSTGFPGIGLGMPPPPFLCPPFPFMPFSVPPPMVPPNLASLSAEELRRMESNARESVEARLQCLRRIQLLLDASVVLMQQYSAAAAVSGVINVPSAQSNESPSANHAQNEAEHSKATLEKTNHNREEDYGEGAVGFTPPQSTPASADLVLPNECTSSEDQELSREHKEIRKRRLQKFAQDELAK